MSDYQKMVREEAKEAYPGIKEAFEADKDEHGGASDSPNLLKWLDRTRKLFERVDEVSKGWGRAEVEMVKSNSRNAVPYGDPKESAYFAYYKDVVHEVKKLYKAVH